MIDWYDINKVGNMTTYSNGKDLTVRCGSGEDDVFQMVINAKNRMPSFAEVRKAVKDLCPQGVKMTVDTYDISANRIYLRRVA